MNQQPILAAQEVAREPLAQAIVQLARGASIEINVQDARHLAASQALLAPGTTIYVSHLPGQSWEATEAMCRSVHEAGFDPIPHVPVRLIADAEALDRLLASLVRIAHVNEVLLVAGDYPIPIGPYSTAGEVLASGVLGKHGLTRVSVAGHPEGHPTVALADIREAERDKVRLATAANLEVTLVTQFFFESAPFLDWVQDLRAHGIRARIRGGLAGPAGLATLFRYSMRCGVGPSIRALGTRPTSLKNLIGDHGPDRLMCELAQALAAGTTDFNGIHLFCFGGYLRTCEWLHRVAEGRFDLNKSGGFKV